MSALRALFQMLATETGAMESSIKGRVREFIDLTLQKLDVQSVPLLCEQLGSSAAEVRRWAAQYLGEYAHPQAIRLYRKFCIRRFHRLHR